MVTRAEAVQIAQTYKGTPYILRGHVKGAGVDCGSYIACYLEECGFAKRKDFDEIGLYTHDWFCHSSEERYMLRLLRHAPKILESVCRGTVDAKPGSLALFKAVRSRLFNHGGIVTKWPFILHATADGVKESDATKYHLTAGCPMAIFDPWSTEC